MSVKKLLEQRRTIRKFSDKKIPESLISDYINLARLSPSAANLQPLKYASVTNGDAVCEILKHVKWAGYLKGEYNPKEDETPQAFIAILNDKEVSSPYSQFDAGAAIMAINTAAEEDGVGCCIIGSVNREEVMKIIDLNEDFELLYLIALGYKKESPVYVDMKNDDVKYYLDGKTLNVPKRKLSDVLIKNIK